MLVVCCDVVLCVACVLVCSHLNVVRCGVYRCAVWPVEM